MEEKVTFPGFLFRNLYVEFLPLAPLFILCSGHLVCELTPPTPNVTPSGLGFYLAKVFGFLLYRAARRMEAEDYLLLEVEKKYIYLLCVGQLTSRLKMPFLYVIISLAQN